MLQDGGAGDHPSAVENYCYDKDDSDGHEGDGEGAGRGGDGNPGDPL